ncbi:hypothetical protein [Providencia rettgeri]|uniref:hypothetical protein n=1 Tax=Providencia rettgeri TaxID=587 RepID=UPI0034E084E5
MKILKYTQCVLLTPLLFLSACSISPSLYKPIKAFDNSKFISKNQSIIFEVDIPKNTQLEFDARYSSSHCSDTELVFPSGDFTNPTFKERYHRGFDEKIYLASNDEQKIKTVLPLTIDNKCEWKLEKVKSTYTYYGYFSDGKQQNPIEYKVVFYLASKQPVEESYSITPELYIIDVTNDDSGMVEKKKQALYKEVSSVGVGLNYTNHSGETVNINQPQNILIKLNSPIITPKNILFQSTHYQDSTSRDRYSCTITYPDGTIYFSSSDEELLPPNGAIINRKGGECKIYGENNPKSQINTLLKRKDVEAKFSLAKLYKSGSYLPIDNAKAYALFKDVAESGNREAIREMIDKAREDKNNKEYCYWFKKEAKFYTTINKDDRELCGIK